MLSLIEGWWRTDGVFFGKDRLVSAWTASSVPFFVLIYVAPVGSVRYVQ